MKGLIALAAFAILAVSTWLTLTGRWITPSINAWQASVMGDRSYYPALTIFLLAIPPLLLLALIKKMLDKRTG